MYKNLLPLLTIVCGALIGSWLLLPSSQELALIQLKDKQYQSAETRYKQLFADGEHSVDVIRSLTELSLLNGDVERAADYFKRYSDRHPDNLEAREYLGRLYRYAQRHDDYLANLEILAQRTPTPSILRELSQLYSYRQDYDRQIGVLIHLMEVDPGHRAFRTLLTLQAQRQDTDQILATLDKVPADSWLYQDHESAFLAIELYLQHQRPERASRLVRLWLAREQEPRILVELVDIAKRHGYNDDALSWLEPHRGWRKVYPDLDETWLQLELSAGDRQAVLQQLSARADNRELPDYLADDYLELLLSSNQVQRALAFSKRSPLRQFPKWLLLRLAELAIEQRDSGLIKQMAGALDEDDLQHQPLLGAALSLGRGDWVSADRWLDKQLRQLRFADSSQLLTTARFLQRRGRSENVRQVLVELMQRPLDADSLLDATRIALQIDVPALVVDALSSASGGEAEYARALMALGTGRQVPLNPGLSSDRLREMYDVASSGKNWSMAALAASQLYQRDRSAQSRRRLAQAQLKLGDYAQARELLRSDYQLTGTVDYDYLEVLLKMRKTEAFERDLQQLLAVALASSQKPQRDALMFWLLDKGAGDLLTAKIQELAYAGDADWHHEYLERLAQDDERLVRYARHALSNSVHSPEMRQQLAYRLLERGLRNEAEEAFKQLAAASPASDPMVRQLVYLWGPKPRSNAREWLRNRARQAPQAQHREWLQHLAQIEDWQGVVELAQPVGDSDQTALKLDALLHLGKQREAKRLLKAYLEQWARPEDLPKAAEFAEQLGLNALAASSLRRYLEAHPRSAPQLRALATLTLQEGHPDRARSYFKRYHELSDGDLESHFLHAQALVESGYVDRARRHFDLALQRSALIKRPDRRHRALLAQVHYHLGNTKQALQLYSELVAQQQADSQLTADYGSLLLEKTQLKALDELLQQAQLKGLL